MKEKQCKQKKQRQHRPQRPKVHYKMSRESRKLSVIVKTLKCKTLKNVKLSEETMQRIKQAIEQMNSDLGERLLNDLLEIINTISDDIEGKGDDQDQEEREKVGEYRKYIKGEGSFKYKSPITLKALIAITLAYGDKGLAAELSAFYKDDIEAPKPSALCQRRDLVDSGLFKEIFDQFCDQLFKITGVLDKTYLGYWILAIDGSKIRLPKDKNDESTQVKTKNSKIINQLHLHAVYDVLNRVYAGAILKSDKEMDERTASRQLLTTLESKYKVDPDKVILLLDRGYDGWYQVSELCNSGHNFVLRTKDIESNGMLSSLLKSYNITGEYDQRIDVTLTKNQKRKGEDNVLVLKKKVNFPYLDDNEDIKVSIRVVRVDLQKCMTESSEEDSMTVKTINPKDRYECLITNLPENVFPLDEMRSLYWLRWGIEIAYRKLKVFADLRTLHHRKRNSIEQEIWAQLTTFNYYSATNFNVTKIWQSIEETFTDEMKARLKCKHAHEINFVACVTEYGKLLRKCLQSCLPEAFQDDNIVVCPIISVLRRRTPKRKRKAVPRYDNQPCVHSFGTRSG